MLTLPIKKKWFDMITSGEKLEEYREDSDYYRKRFYKLFGKYALHAVYGESPTTTKIKLRNGYSRTSPTCTVDCSLKIGTGNPDWGAEPDKTYLVLIIKRVSNITGAQ